MTLGFCRAVIRLFFAMCHTAHCILSPWILHEKLSFWFTSTQHIIAGSQRQLLSICSKAGGETQWSLCNALKAKHGENIQLWNIMIAPKQPGYGGINSCHLILTNAWCLLLRNASAYTSYISIMINRAWLTAWPIACQRNKTSASPRIIGSKCQSYRLVKHTYDPLLQNHC